MRTRLRLAWVAVVLGLALLLPATTAAASLGSIKAIDGWCTGNNSPHATFKLTKFSGFYASRLSITGIVQKHTNKWTKVATIGTESKQVNTNAKASMQATFSYNPGENGMFRIIVLGKIWNGSVLLAQGKTGTGGYCW